MLNIDELLRNPPEELDPTVCIVSIIWPWWWLVMA